MLKCPRCGTDNALGCVFCSRCGAKLDMTGVTSEAVAKATRRSWLRRHKRLFLAVPILALVASGVLAFWPRTRPLGASGTPVGAQRVVARLESFAELEPGRRLGADPAFTEADINGYFRYKKPSDLPVASCSVHVTPRAIRARVIRRLGGGVEAAKFRLSPLISYDLLFVPSGGELAVVKAWFGHLPAPGPLRGMLARRLRHLYSGQPQWKVLSDVIEISLGDGQVGVVVEKE